MAFPVGAVCVAPWTTVMELRKIRFGRSRMKPSTNYSRAARLRRASAPSARGRVFGAPARRRAFGAPLARGRAFGARARQRTRNAQARRCAPRRNRVPVRRAGDAQASKVGSRSAKCFLFDNDHRGAWSALVPFAGGHTILNCISEEIGVLPGALWRSQKCFQKCSRKCSGK